MRHFAASSVVALALVVTACGDRQVADPAEIQRRADRAEAAPRVVKVADVVGEKLAPGREKIEVLGLKTKVRERFSDRKSGTVVAQRPKAGDDAESGSAVTLFVSKGPEPPPAAPSGPTGVLGTSSVGPVRVGMDAKQAEGLFGPPPRKEEVNFGRGPAPQIDWVWTYPDGEFRLQFETTGGTVTGYQSGTANVATASGAKVGASFAPIQEKYGDQLEKSPIGAPTKGDDGIWLLSENEPGSYPALSFAVEGGVITNISGGEFQAAGE